MSHPIIGQTIQSLEMPPSSRLGKLPLTKATADRHVLYENSVQGVDGLLDMLAKIFRKRRKRVMRTFREDFCGTAHMSCDWVARSPENRAWGIDLDRPTLKWAEKVRLPPLGEAAERLTLLRDDVLTAHTPPVDMIGAFNFSFNIFKDRDVLLRYFKHAYEELAPDGLLVIDEFGGPESHANTRDKKKVKDATTPDGMELPTFTYIWEQRDYNPITHDILCHIHFKFKDGTRWNRAFEYDWRLWTVPELQDLLKEAGFKRSDVYLQGWDDDADDADGEFIPATHLEGEWNSWFAYIVAEK